MMIQPMRDRIVVLQDDLRTDVTPAGIIIAASKGIVESQSQLGRTGTVHAVGEDVDEGVKVGDRIIYGEFIFPEYVEAGVRYLVMQDADIVGVIEE